MHEYYVLRSDPLKGRIYNPSRDTSTDVTYDESGRVVGGYDVIRPAPSLRDYAPHTPPAEPAGYDLAPPRPRSMEDLAQDPAFVRRLQAAASANGGEVEPPDGVVDYVAFWARVRSQLPAAWVLETPYRDGSRVGVLKPAGA